MTQLIERLIRALDKGLLPTPVKGGYLSGELGILVVDHRGSYTVTIISKDLLLSAERLQDLKCQLEKDPFTDMEVKLYLDEVTEFRDRNLKFAQFHIFVKEKERK